MGNTSQATERSPHWEGFLPGVPWSPPSPRGQKRLQMLREELVQATTAPKNSLRQGAGKSCWRCRVKARLADNWATSPNPARGEKSSPGRSRCHNGLGENGISTIGWQFLHQSATNPCASFSRKSWQPFPAPPAKRSCALSQAPTLFLVSCHWHPTYFKKYSSLNTHFPLWMCCVLSGFFFSSSLVPLEYNHFRAGSTHLFGTWPVLPRVFAVQSSSVNFTEIMPWSAVINCAPINHLGLCSGERNAQSHKNLAKCFKTSKRGQILRGSEVLEIGFFYL